MRLGTQKGDGRVMAQAVNRWPETAEARVRAFISPFGVSGGQSSTVTGFSQSSFPSSSYPSTLIYHVVNEQ
jgi:hypothetical protein